jgi:hypothetical protein
MLTRKPKLRCDTDEVIWVAQRFSDEAAFTFRYVSTQEDNSEKVARFQSSQTGVMGGQCITCNSVLCLFYDNVHIFFDKAD